MKLVKALSAVIVALMIVSVTLTNRSVDESIVVAYLTKEIGELQNQNTILKAQVASAGSLSKLSAKLEDAGFIESPKVVSLPTTSSVASR